MICTMTPGEDGFIFPEARASSQLSSKRTQIITRPWQKFQQQSERVRACGMKNETGSIWLCPQVRKKERPYGSTRPKIRRVNSEDFSYLAGCCRLPHCIQRDRIFARGCKAAASTRSDNSVTKRKGSPRPHGRRCQR